MSILLQYIWIRVFVNTNAYKPDSFSYTNRQLLHDIEGGDEPPDKVQ